MESMWSFGEKAKTISGKQTSNMSFLLQIISFTLRDFSFSRFSISIFIYVVINCAYIAIMLEFKYNVLDIACETNATNLAYIPSCGNVSHKPAL